MSDYTQVEKIIINKLTVTNTVHAIELANCIENKLDISLGINNNHKKREIRKIINEQLKPKLIENKMPFTITSGNYGYKMAFAAFQPDREEIEHHIKKELASIRSRENNALLLAEAFGVDVRG